MKIISALIITFLLFSVSLYSQEPGEKNVIAKGCEKIQDNLKLKHCLRKQLSNTFSRTLSKRLINEMNTGTNKFFLELQVKSDKSINLISLNSPNPTIKKEFERTLSKVKIVEPGYVEGKAVDVIFNLQLTMTSETTGISANYNLSKLTDKNDYSSDLKIYPTLKSYCLNHKDKEENFKCFDNYIKNFFFNSVDLKQINSILNPGMNFFEVKILYNEIDKITEISSLSGISKLDAVFEKNISEVFKKSGFKSPSINEVSYGGEMMFYIFYMKD